jgi:hypothetical protein
MKNTRVSKAALASVLLFSAMTFRPAAAQVINLVKFTLPFNAVIAGNSLAAGAYTVKLLDAGSGNSVLMFTSAAGSIEVLASPITSNATSARTELIVDEQGSQRGIRKIWLQGQSVGYEFPAAR